MIQTAVYTDKIVFEGVRNFSPAITFDCGQCFRFDVLADGSAEALACASEIDIFSCGTGFRAKYISDAAKKVASGEINLENISSLDDENARAELMKICGVGPKVANCALLFGFHRLSSFPIDVWIKRVLDKYYKNGIDLGDLGDYAGVAQQYLFYYERYKNGEEIK